MGVVQDGSTNSLCLFSEFQQAKEMVAIADKVASKLEEKKGSITEDEVNNYGHTLMHNFSVSIHWARIVIWCDGDMQLILYCLKIFEKLFQILFGSSPTRVSSGLDSRLLVIKTTLHRDSTLLVALCSYATKWSFQILYRSNFRKLEAGATANSSTKLHSYLGLFVLCKDGWAFL